MFEHNERQPDSRAKRVLTRSEASESGTTYLQPSNHPANQRAAVSRLLPHGPPIGRRREAEVAGRVCSRCLRKERTNPIPVRNSQKGMFVITSLTDPFSFSCLFCLYYFTSKQSLMYCSNERNVIIPVR